MYDDLSGIITPRRFHKAHEDFCRERLTWVWSWLAENPLLNDQQYESLIHNLKMISLQTEEIQDDLANSRRTLQLETLRETCAHWLKDYQNLISKTIDQALDRLNMDIDNPQVYHAAIQAITKLKQSYL